MLIEGGLLGWLQANRSQIYLSVRVTTAAFLAFVVAHLLDLPQGYWAVFTAIVVMQASVGGSVKTGIDWFVGTVGGAVVGVAVATVLPQGDFVARCVAIAAVVAPLALLAAVRPSFRVAPLTAVIVVLGLNPAFSPLQSALHRVLEITVGSTIGVVVSLTVFPARAHVLVIQAAADALQTCAALLRAVLEAVGEGQVPATESLQAALQHALSRLEALTDEAQRERAARLSTEIDAGPLGRTLRRLQSDLIIMVRAVDPPLPAEIVARLAPAIHDLTQSICAFLTDTATALRNRQPAPDLAPASAALANYGAAITVLRRERATRSLSDEAVGHLFAFGFALEQLHNNFKDFGSRTTELAQNRG